jgi:membrane associated rhomboid family serine protease
MANASHTIREELHGIVLFVGCIWGVFLLTLVFPSLGALGVVPRTLSGLVGVAAAPFLHASLHHLFGNTVPLLVLLALLAGSQARSWEIVIGVVLLGGLLLWTFGRSANHIGASGLVFGLIAFLIVSGIVERRIVPLIVTAVVASLYGGTLLWGVLPCSDPHMSWDGHLCSAVAGALVAYAAARRPAPQGDAGEEGADGGVSPAPSSP